MIPLPFIVQIDSNESHPFTFENLAADSPHSGQVIGVETVWESCGRYPDSMGDYTVHHYLGLVGVERKSRDDCWGTIIGFGKDGETGRRERFESELENLAKMDGYGLVVVEAGYEEVLQSVRETDKRTATENRKLVERSILSYQQRFNVAWHFAGSRRSAERYTLRWLQRWWKKET